MANAQANTTTAKKQTPREMFRTGNTELFTAVLSLDKIQIKKKKKEKLLFDVEHSGRE